MFCHTKAILFPLLAISAFFMTTTGFSIDFQIMVNPQEMTAGTYQNVEFEIVVGEPGLKKGSGIRIEIPVAYLETAPYFWDKPQTDLADGRGYVEVATSSKAKLMIKLYGASGGIIECDILEGIVKPGEKIELKYSGIVQSLSWKMPVRCQWRKIADDEWNYIPGSPVLRFLPQNEAILIAVSPATVNSGENFDLVVVALDKFGNPAARYRGTVNFTSTDPSSKLPESYTFTLEDAGIHVFRNLKYNTSGLQCVTVSDGALKTGSNYSSVSGQPENMQIFFGETHFHTGTGMGHQAFTETRAGGDHRGHFISQEESYAFLRDVMRLDFASAADHDVKALDEKVWKRCQDVTDSFNDPGKFTTFYAYEWTAAPNVGHHVVMYKDKAGKVLNHFDYVTKPRLWEALDKQNIPALVIPHCMWAQPDHGIWDDINDKYQRIGEIYSLWNNRFLLLPADDIQRFEIGINDKWSYQYAWNKGHRIGVIGSSDNHTGHPGMNNYTVDMQHPSGLAAVYATENTRKGIWEAFQARRVYATTGTRIYLEFTSDGNFMGEEYSTSKPPQFSVKAGGTNRIVSVEIVKHDSSGYHTIREEKPDAETVVFQFTDKNFKEDSFYYVRVTQVDEPKRGAWAYPTGEMAWSSPIWVNLEK